MPLIRGRVGLAAEHVCAAPGGVAGASVVSVGFRVASRVGSVCTHGRGGRRSPHRRSPSALCPTRSPSARGRCRRRSCRRPPPQLLSNLEPALYSGSAQPAHAKCPPAGLNCTYSPLNGCSVPPIRSTWNWSRVSTWNQSASLLARGPSSLSSRRPLPRPRTAATITAAPPAATATAAGRATRRSAASMELRSRKLVATTAPSR